VAAKEKWRFDQSGIETQEVAGLKLVKRDFGDEADVDRMVQTANEIIQV